MKMIPQARRVKPRKLAALSEHEEQKAVVVWCNLMRPKYPELFWIYAIPNAAKRSAQLAAYMKAEGMKAGVPDLCLPVARHGYHGLYIEMKKQRGGRLTDNQKEWIHGLNEQGYLAVRCNGAQMAIKQLLEYLEG